jgi:ankyrin repeat protein
MLRVAMLRVSRRAPCCPLHATRHAARFTPRRKTPLHHAAEYGHVSVAVLLMAFGADVNCTADDGCVRRAKRGRAHVRRAADDACAA